MCFSKFCDGSCKTADELRVELGEYEEANKQNEQDLLKLKADYESFKDSCSLDAQAAAQKIVQLQNENAIIQAQIEALQALANPDSLIPPALDELLEFYRKKYPAVNVIYNGRYYETKDGNKTYYPEDVRMFITPADFRFKNQTKPFNLAQMIKENKGDFHKGCDALVWLVWNFLPPRYTSEPDAWGVTEYWNTPQESYAGAPLDCEDHSNRLVSYLRAAGLPAKMIYNVVGDTKLGGHSTVFYFASDRKWHHLEATAQAQPILDTATKANPDELWVNTVWFRFNDLESFSAGVDDATGASLRRDLGNFFKIETIK